MAQKAIIGLSIVPLHNQKRDVLLLSGCCLCTPRKIFEKVGGFKEKKDIMEDIEYSIDIESFGKKAYFPNIKVKSSLRRWEKGMFATISHYSKKGSTVSEYIRYLFRKTNYKSN